MVCLKSGAIACPSGVGAVGLEMARYACGVLWKPWEVPYFLVGALATDSGAAALCFCGLCCGAMSSLTGSHLLATFFLLVSALRVT